jgi:hypothetical protein
MCSFNVDPSGKANFFWNSNNLSVYEYACLNSFVKNDFDVDVYSFCNIKLPQGVVLKNASSILDQKEIKKFIHDGKAGCLAAFTDKFRIELQKKNLGWWFDMDVVCLKNSKYFSKLEKGNKFIIGMETNNKINNAVLKISDKNLASHISKKILETGYNFKLGGIGPDLITKILKKEKILYKAQPRYKFYAINYQNFNVINESYSVNGISISIPEEIFEALANGTLLTCNNLPNSESTKLPSKFTFTLSPSAKLCVAVNRIQIPPKAPS